MEIFGWIVEFADIKGFWINSKLLKKHHSEFYYWGTTRNLIYREDLHLTYKYLIKESGFLIRNRRTDWQLLEEDFDLPLSDLTEQSLQKYMENK